MSEPITDEEIGTCENYPDGSEYSCVSIPVGYWCRPCRIRVRIDAERARADAAVAEANRWRMAYEEEAECGRQVRERD